MSELLHVITRVAFSKNFQKVLYKSHPDLVQLQVQCLGQWNRRCRGGFYLYRTISSC